MLILASKSPRRIDMLKSKGYDFRIVPSEAEENNPIITGMKELPMYLSLKKALDVETRTDPGDIIVAADTIVYTDRAVGKPKDEEDAKEMLLSYSGNSHYVITGVSIIKAHADYKVSFASVSRVFFKEFTYEDIKDYIKTEEPYDKAGAYAIQGWFSKYIDRYVGSLNNIIGFPLEEIEPYLKAIV